MKRGKRKYAQKLSINKQKIDEIVQALQSNEYPLSLPKIEELVNLLGASLEGLQIGKLGKKQVFLYIDGVKYSLDQAHEKYISLSAETEKLLKEANKKFWFIF